MFRSCMILMGLLLLAGPAESTVRRVPAQYPTIQSAINAASTGDTVLVSPGTYSESLTLPHRGIILLSTNGYSVTQVIQITFSSPSSNVYQTTVSGFTSVNGFSNASGGGSWSGSLTLQGCAFGPFAGVTLTGMEFDLTTVIRDCVFTGANGVSSAQYYLEMMITGCTLQSTAGISANGYPVRVSNCQLAQGSIQTYSEGHGVTVTNCTLQGGEIRFNADGTAEVTGNHLTGGAIRFNNQDGGTGSISGNTLVGGSILVEGGGARGDVYVSGNQITNGAISVGGALLSYIDANTITNGGTAIYASSFDLDVLGNTIRNCTEGIAAYSYYVHSNIIGNDIRGCSGTGIAAPDADDAVVEQNVVAGCGTGIVFVTGSCRRNTIVGCTSRGLVLVPTYVEPQEISGTIVVGNAQGVVVETPTNPARFTCNDVWSNAGGNWIGIADPTNQNGNISVDPLFCDTNFGLYTLAAGSPCLPGHHPAGADCGTIGALGTGCAGPTDVPDSRDASAAAGPLLSVAPNPARSSVHFQLQPTTSPAGVELYTVDGALVRRLQVDPLSSGSSTVRWDLRDASGHRVPPGIYFARVPHSALTRKLVVVE